VHRGVRIKALAGQRFGRLVARSRVIKNGKSHWVCRCDCGNVVRVALINLGRNTRSCGCIRREVCRARERRKNHPTHGVVLTYYKRNARLAGHEWALTADQFWKLIQDRCHYCGAPPRQHRIIGRNLTHNGIDRIDSTKGYTTDNVVSCCTTCNRAKLTMTAPEFLGWARHVAIHQGWI
jgi:hypothetical protein